MSPEIAETHAEIIELQQEMCNDKIFHDLCDRPKLKWDFENGYEPRWYNGPAPKDVQLLFLMAEPGAIGEHERQNLLPAVAHMEWLHGYDIKAKEHYWRSNLWELCSHVWPEDTDDHMRRYLGGSCTFWMSLPEGSQTSQIPRQLEDYFLQKYLGRFLALFPHALLLAAGGKSRVRLNRFAKQTKNSVAFESCWAFTRPGCNQAKAHESWRRVGEVIKRRLAGQ
jgi:hypothetical protein